MSKRVCKEDQIQLIMEYQFVEHIDDIWDCIEVKCVSDTMVSWAIQSSDLLRYCTQNLYVTRLRKSVRT